MQNNNNIPESIWADGCPDVVKDEDKITQRELLGMAVDYVVKKVIIPRGFKIEQGFPREEYPNIICKKDGEVYAIVVAPSIFPNFMAMTDEFRLKFVEQAKQNKCNPLFAAVGYKSIDEERAKAGLVLKGDVFITSFPGFHRLTDAKTQSFTVPVEELYRP